MATRSHHGHAPVEPDHPYLDWAVATDLAYLRAGDWVPLLVEFNPDKLPAGPSGEGAKDPSVAQRFSRGEWLAPELREWIYVPPVFIDMANTVRGLAALPLTVLLLERDHVGRIVTDPSWRSTILRAEMGPPVFLQAKRSAPGTFETTPRAGSGSGTANGPVRRVLIGVIDQGIAFAHARFRNKSGSRVAHVWQQEFVTDFSPTPIGQEMTAAEIDQALAVAQGDEDRVYRDLGGLRFDVEGYKPLARQRTHGTHVLDLAAGAAIDADVTDRPIIAVDMPEQAIGDPAGSTLTPHALWALVYILSRADALRKPGETLPVIVNMSYGPHEGPHDGSTLFERFADLLIEQMSTTPTPLRIVLAAGNSRQSRIHAAPELQPGETRTLHWRLQPCGRTPSAMELWWPAGQSLRVTLRSPTKEAVTVSAANPKGKHPLNGPAVFRADYAAPAGSARSRVVLTIAPTELDPRVIGGHPVAPSGVWQVEVTSDAQSAITPKAWIKRGDTPPGRRAKGRQSYFDEADYRRYDDGTRPLAYDDPAHPSAVIRLGSLSGIATGRHTTVVGGYRRTDFKPASYSSAGPHDNSARIERSPSLLAGSDDSAVLRGVLAAGTRSGSVVRINGTSAAAPRVTRWLADQWQQGGEPPDVAAAQLHEAEPAGARPAELPLVAGHGLLP